MILLDANYILRFLLKDNIEMYEIVKDTIVSNDCSVLNEVFAEVIFVLLKVYKIKKDDISSSLQQFLGFDNIIMSDKQVILQSLEIFVNKNLDFIDCVLCAKSKEYKIKTFDKQLQKCINSKNN
ncbi:PIN domain-containing protein [Arcobacter sp. FWKO B]|uniref:PIN domain-containing protein n=1 Tax=Arcobacter sp. FWKO B TaxID=2593672 RepID=UPI0018A5F312|nr:PIN domain-containing protein [Arcobacter sp. FWKO B]QOG11639.1 type II toxin-antitoxin system VapC family toxin [Arcobacter sp. FWKO B]